MLSVGRCCCSSAGRDHPSGPDPRVDGLGTSCSAITVPHSGAPRLPVGTGRGAGGRVMGWGSPRSAVQAAPARADIAASLRGAHSWGRGAPAAGQPVNGSTASTDASFNHLPQTTAGSVRLGSRWRRASPRCTHSPGTPVSPAGCHCPRGSAAQAAGTRGTRELGVQVWE